LIHSHLPQSTAVVLAGKKPVMLQILDFGWLLFCNILLFAEVPHKPADSVVA